MSSLRPYFGSFPRAAILVLMLLAVLAGGGCNSAPKPPKYFVQFYMEAPPGAGVPFTLPISNVNSRRMTDYFMTGADVARVDEGFVTDIAMNVRHSGVIFTFNPLQQHELMIETANNLSRRIILYANDQPMGVHLIDQPIENGQLFFFVEIADPVKLKQFITDLQDSQKRLEEMKKK